MWFRFTSLTIALAIFMAVPAVTWAQSDSGSDSQVDLKTLKKFYDDAKALYGQGKYSEARVLFIKVKEMAQQAKVYSVMIDYRIGLCYEGEGDYENAIKHYRIYVNAQKLPRKGPTKKEVRARIRRLKRELAASPLPHAPAAGTMPSGDEYVEEDITSPDGAPPPPPPQGQRTAGRGGNALPPPPAGGPAPKPAPRQRTAMEWWGEYGVYVVIAVAATAVIVGMATSGSMTHGPDGQPSPSPEIPPDTGNGLTVLSW